MSIEEGAIFGPEESDFFVNIDLEKKKEDARRAAKLLREQHANTVRYIVTLQGEVKEESKLNKDEKLAEFYRCALDPVYFIETYLTIFDQTQNAIVPFKLFDFQKDLISAYRQNRFNVANKYRQAGVSTTTCAYITWYVMFTENAKVAVVANKLETARDELMSDIVDFIDQCPDYLKPETDEGDGKKKKELKNAAGHKKFVKGREIKAFAPSTLRGLTPTLIFWDETAWAERGDKFWESARPTLQTGGGAIFVSTPNGLDPVFYKTFDGAPKNKFNAIELWWYNDPRYIKNKKTGEVDLEWVKTIEKEGKKSELRIKDENFSKEKRADLVKDGYRATSTWFEEYKLTYNGNDRQLAQEMLCSFLGSGDNFVGEENIKYAKENTKRDPIRKEWTDHGMWIWEDPIENAVYAMGVDVSKGNAEDSSVISIIKVTASEETITVTDARGNIRQKIKRRRKTEQVAEYKGKKSPQELAYIAYEFGKKYNDAYAVIDITGGYGISTVDKMKELGYHNFYYGEISNKTFQDQLGAYRQVRTRIKAGEFKEVETHPGLMIGQNRGVILIGFERAIRERDFIIRSTRLIDELGTFVTDKNPNRVADHGRTSHDDTIIAVAIAIYVVDHDMDLAKESARIQKVLLEAMTRVNNNTGQISRVIQQPNQPAYYMKGSDPKQINSWVFRDKQMWIQHTMREEGISRDEAERLYYERKPFR